MKRTLKIEEVSEPLRNHAGRPTYGSRTVPRVRLRGKWLQAAGFNPGAHLELTVVSTGVIELRVCGPVQLKAKDWQNPADVSQAIAETAQSVSRAARRSWARKAVQS